MRLSTGPTACKLRSIPFDVLSTDHGGIGHISVRKEAGGEERGGKYRNGSGIEKE